MEQAAGKLMVRVDPEIARVIENAGAPIGVPAMIPAPATLPGKVGFVQGLLGLYGALRHGTAAMHDYRERYGDLYRAQLLTRSVVIVWDADEIQKILRNEDATWSTAMGWDAIMFQNLDAQRGNIGALLTLDFDEHRLARKLVQPAFTQKALAGYLAIAKRGFEAEIPRWLAAGAVDFKREVRTLLARVAGEIFTGVKDPAQVAQLDRALAEFWRGMMVVSRSSMSGTFRRARRGFQTLRTFFLERVAERRANPGDDLFSQMCAAEDEDQLGDEAMVRVFLTVMFGAFDTTSAGVTSMAYLLAKHPEWQDRLREEATRAGELDVASLKSLKECEWAWKETLRLMPVSTFLPRRALRDVEIGGHQLRAGTLVAPMAGGLGRHPKWWKDPLKFDPLRFSPERAEDKQHPAIHLPFGAGPHACIGMQLSNMEVKMFWHHVLRRCRFRLAKDYEARHTHTPMGCVSGKVRLVLEPL